MRVFQLLLVTVGLAAGLGCETEEPCDRYVEYMCDCHDGGEVSCEELSATYIGADPEVQDQCAIELTSQEDADADDPDFSCAAG